MGHNTDRFLDLYELLGLFLELVDQFALGYRTP